MGFVIREATAADVDALVALHIATWREAYAHLLPQDFFTPEFEQSRRDMWRHVLGHPRPERVVRVADVGGALVGFAFVGPPPAEEAPRQRHLYSIYVLASHYGTGIGQALLDAVLGDEPAMLWVAKENPRAIAFYRRNGFALDGEEQIDPMAPKITDARMVR